MFVAELYEICEHLEANDKIWMAKVQIIWIELGQKG